MQEGIPASGAFSFGGKWMETMEVTFIGHSGFLVRTEKENFLFDYYRGTIPQMEKEKPLFVFASHKHADHFNPEIFRLADLYPQITFVLSYDIRINPHHMEKWQLREEVAEKILTVRANEVYEPGNFKLRTLKSTDAGVAFLLMTEAGTIYHAGDLNWWFWEGENKQQNNNMSANFKREIDKLTDIPIDVAFVPLDPRLEAHYFLGMEYLMKRAKIRYVFPMHCWEDYDVADRFIREGHAESGQGEVMKITWAGQTFRCD